MESWQILLLIVMIVGFFYVVLLLFVVSHGAEFRRRLRHRALALWVVMGEKQRLLIRLFDLFEAHSTPFSETDVAALEAMKALNLEKAKPAELKNALSILKSAQSRLAYRAQTNPLPTPCPEYEEILSALEENDRFIRRGIASYNMDVIALNYWCSIPTAGWINYVFGIHKRESL